MNYYWLVKNTYVIMNNITKNIRFNVGLRLIGDFMLILC